MTAIELSKEQVLDADTKAIQQILFTGNLQSFSKYFETFNVLHDFPLTTSGTMCDYYL